MSSIEDPIKDPLNIETSNVVGDLIVGCGNPASTWFTPINTATLTCLAVDNATQMPVGVGCYHVLRHIRPQNEPYNNPKNLGKQDKSTDIYISPNVGPSRPTSAGNYLRGMLLDWMDTAIFTYTGQVIPNTVVVNGVTYTITSVGSPQIGQAVYKSGAQTGVVAGTTTSVQTSIAPAQYTFFSDPANPRGTYNYTLKTQHAAVFNFSAHQGGDSGAAIFTIDQTNNTAQLVSIAFAMASAAEVYGNDAAVVFKSLNISL